MTHIDPIIEMLSYLRPFPLKDICVGSVNSHTNRKNIALNQFITKRPNQEKYF